jgi:hypothetical protein
MYQGGTSVKKTIVLILIVVLILAAFPGVAFADGPGNSEPGGDRYGEISQHANPDAQCGTGAGSGAFGYLGKDLNPGQETWDGGNGTKPGTTSRTGTNNSAVCGHNQ